MGRPGGGARIGGGARMSGSRSSFSRSSGSFRPSGGSRSSFGSSRPTTPTSHVSRPTSHVSRPTSHVSRPSTTHRPSDTYRPTSHVTREKPRRTSNYTDNSASSFGMGMGMGYAMGRNLNRTYNEDYQTVRKAAESYSTPARSSYSSPARSSYSTLASRTYDDAKKSAKNGFKRVLILAIATLCIALLYNSMKNKDFDTNPNEARQKLVSGLSYDSNVVLEDQTGWIEEPDTLGKKLEYFWEKTGVQPYIMMLTHNPELTTDYEKEQHTVALYNELIDREDALLFVYYGEPNLEEDVGLMCYALGKQTSSVFDSEAIDNWLACIDYCWYSEYLTMTEVYIEAYEDTADDIMRQPINLWGGFCKFIRATLKVAAIFVGTIAVIVTVIVIVAVLKEKKEKKAKETERILSTSLEELAGQAEKKDDLLAKYKD